MILAKIGKYLYGIIKESNPIDLQLTGIGPLKRPVELITYKDLSAAISTAPLTDYYPSRELLMGHEKVIEGIIKHHTIIPFRFGTVAKNKNEILDIIEKYYDDFISQLEKLDGKIELGLKVSWLNDAFNQDIETPEITWLKNKLAGKPENQIYNEKLELGRMVEAAVEKKRKEYSEEILNALENLLVEYKENDILNVKMVYNASFLVEKKNEQEFDKALEGLYKIYMKTLDFKYTGPWAPYNFTDLTIKLNGQ